MDNKFLNEFEIDKDRLLGIGIGVTGTAIMSLLMSIASLFWTISTVKSISKWDKELSKKVRRITKNSKWRVYIIKDKHPNAFCIIKDYIFITSGAKNLLNEKELLAVCLHEAGHIVEKHLVKELIYKNSFLAIVVGILSFLGGPAAAIALTTLYWGMGDEALNILARRLMGRRNEIRADNFAVKYGYGDALISSLNKIEKHYKKHMETQKCGIICKILTKINDILDEHPPLKKRIENILKNKQTWDGVGKGSVSSIRNNLIKAFAKKGK